MKVADGYHAPAIGESLTSDTATCLPYGEQL